MSALTSAIDPFRVSLHGDDRTPTEWKLTPALRLRDVALVDHQRDNKSHRAFDTAAACSLILYCSMIPSRRALF